MGGVCLRGGAWIGRRQQGRWLSARGPGCAWLRKLRSERPVQEVRVQQGAEGSEGKAASHVLQELLATVWLPATTGSQTCDARAWAQGGECRALTRGERGYLVKEGTMCAVLCGSGSDIAKGPSCLSAFFIMILKKSTQRGTNPLALPAQGCALTHEKLTETAQHHRSCSR